MPSRIARALGCALAATTALGAASPSAFANADATCAGAREAPGDVEQAASATLCVVNTERARRGRAPLRESAALTRAATRHSRLMVSRNFFAHVAPWGEDLGDRLQAAGFVRRGQSWNAAENLAWGTGNLSSPAAIVDGWMNSRPHRANLLDPRWRRAGVGVAAGVPKRGGRARGATYTLNLGRAS